MSIKAVFLLVTGCIALTACRPAESDAERDLLREWSARGLSPREHAEVLNKFFTDGTPIATIVGLLGPNYIRVTPFSTVSLDGSPVMCWLEYTNQRVTIGTSARIDGDLDLLAATFTGAGYELDVQPMTNSHPVGQPDGPANRTQPVSPGTNSTSLPAGSGR
jgi:hypothetical protein